MLGSRENPELHRILYGFLRALSFIWSAPAVERKYSRKCGLKIGVILGIEAQKFVTQQNLIIQSAPPDFGFFSNGAVSMKPAFS
jgi:hypothetical protein